VRILFSVRTPANVRQYDGVLRMLAARGHDVLLLREAFGTPRWPPFVRALAEASPRIHLDRMPPITRNPWWELATEFRRARFYLRFGICKLEATASRLAPVAIFALGPIHDQRIN
jgi:hypothetical protein